MLLERYGKLTMWKSKSSCLSYSLVESLPPLSMMNETQPPGAGAISTTVFICRSFAFCVTKRLCLQVEVKSRKTKENGISHVQENGSHSSYEGNH